MAAAVLVAALLPVVGASPASAASLTETEPNSATGAANAIAPGDTISASSLTSSYYDYDYFAVDLPSAGKVKLNLKFPSGLGAGDAYEVEVYNAAGSSLYSFDLDGSQYAGAWLASQAMYAPAGRLFIRVYGSDDWATWGKTYTLNVGHTPGTVETEFNSATGSADSVSLGKTISASSLTSSYYDYDYFAVDLPSAGKVKLNLKFPSGLGAGDAYEVEVYNAAGSSLYSFDLDGSQYAGAWLASQAMYAPAGRLFVRVYGSNQWATWGKTYTLNVGHTPGTVETEINSATGSADSVSLGKTISASSLTASYYDYDYFAVDLPSAGKVKLNLKFPSGLGAGDAYEVEVYNAAGSSLYSFDLDGSQYAGAWLASQAMYAPAGRLFIRVYGSDDWATWGKTYTLNVGHTPGTVETEINSATGSADSVSLGKTISASSLTASYYDYDYFAVDLPSAGKVKLNLKFPSGLGAGDAYEVEVYNAAGSSLYSFDLDGTKASGNWIGAQTVALAKGRSFIRVYGSSDWETWGKSYTLNVARVLTATPTPTISGAVKVGSTLTAKPGTWAPATVSLKYQWLRDGKAISGATSSKYKLIASDAGKKVSVKVTGSKSTYATVAKTSASKVVPLQTLTKTPTPTISGTAKVGKTLSAKAGTWAPASVSLKYQWLRDGKAISGATKSTYKLVTADRGKKVSVKVTGSKATYKTVAKTSAAHRVG